MVARMGCPELGLRVLGRDRWRCRVRARRMVPLRFVVLLPAETHGRFQAASNRTMDVGVRTSRSRGPRIRSIAMRHHHRQLLLAYPIRARRNRREFGRQAFRHRQGTRPGPGWGEPRKWGSKRRSNNSNRVENKPPSGQRKAGNQTEAFPSLAPRATYGTNGSLASNTVQVGNSSWASVVTGPNSLEAEVMEAVVEEVDRDMSGKQKKGRRQFKPFQW